MIKVISFYTNDLYRQCAERMRASAEALGLEVDLLERPDLGTWWQNCNQKAEVIKGAVLKYPDDQVFWTDADAVYYQYPTLIPTLTHCDIALYMINRHHPHSGVMLCNGKKALPYLDKWIEFTAKNPQAENDAFNLRAAIQSIPNRNVGHLPPAYVWIERQYRHRFPHAKPVLFHSYVGAHDYPIR